MFRLLNIPPVARVTASEAACCNTGFAAAFKNEPRLLMSKYFQGLFRPKHPEKYKGQFLSEGTPLIIYRSHWEFLFLKWLDESLDVTCYSSEEIAIPYICPVTGRVRRYFPDVYFETKNGDKYLVEIKPQKFATRPSTRNIRTLAEYAINQAKWEAARKVCEQKNWQFVILTEKELFNK